MVDIAPSIIAADAGDLAAEAVAVEKAGADWLHMDIMDGAFVPNITFGPWVHAAIRDAVSIPLDTHLMVDDPDRFLADYRNAGADLLTVHVEACRHIHRTVGRIRELGAKAGVALNPGTPLEAVQPILGDVDLVLVMSVNPGFAGQAFIPEAVGRVARLNEWKQAGGHEFIIEVDGGVSGKNAGELIAAGATMLVAGSSVYKSENYAEAIESLRG